jgi:CBS domain-containing protein
MKIKDVMTPLVESVHPDDSLREATEKMKSTHLEPMPVTKNGELVGVLTDADVGETAARAGLATGSRRVSDVMRTDIVCCSEDEELAEAVEHLGDEKEKRLFRRLPVVDEDHRLVGSVTVDALRKHVEQDADAGVDAVEAVEAIAELVSYDEDSVDYMSDESFPASDPPPPPSEIGREKYGED